MSTVFRSNPSAAREIANDPEFQAGIARLARAGTGDVQQAAPAGGTGYYRRHIRSSGTRIQLTDPFWHLIEFGSVNNPAYAPLRRGLRASGLRLELHTGP